MLFFAVFLFASQSMKLQITDTLANLNVDADGLSAPPGSDVVWDARRPDGVLYGLPESIKKHFPPPNNPLPALDPDTPETDKCREAKPIIRTIASLVRKFNGVFVLLTTDVNSMHLKTEKFVRVFKTTTLLGIKAGLQLFLCCLLFTVAIQGLIAADAAGGGGGASAIGDSMGRENES